VVRSPPLRVGVLLGRFAPGGVLGGGRVGEPGVRPQGGADARGNLVQPPVELPVISSKVTIARSRGREVSAARSNARCCSSDGAFGAACASGSRFTFAGPKPKKNRLK